LRILKSKVGPFLLALLGGIVLSGAQQERVLAQPQPREPFSTGNAEPMVQVSKAEPQRSNASAVVPAVPSDEKLLTLIYTTLIALNQANSSGNYSVLRDISAPGFQQANNPAQLAQSFANLRGRNLDLSPILLVQPKLVRTPGITANGMLRVSGFFPTRPEQVNFDLLFQAVHGQWRLYGIATDTTQAPSPASAQDTQQQSSAQTVNAASNPTAAASPTSKAKAAKAPTVKKHESSYSSGTSPDLRDKVDQLEVSSRADQLEAPAKAETLRPKDNYNPLSAF
jgi:hypothetical protein